MKLISVHMDFQWELGGSAYFLSADLSLLQNLHVVAPLMEAVPEWEGHWICEPPWQPEPWSVVQGEWQLVPGKGGTDLPGVFPDSHSH